MTSWARRLAGLDLLSKKSKGSLDRGKYSGDDSIVMAASCGFGRVREETVTCGGGECDEEEEEAQGEDAVYDHSDNLARCCREFYERRVLMAAEERQKPATKYLSSSSDLKSLTTVSACSSGYFSLGHTDNPAAMVAANAMPDDVKGIVESAAGVQPKLEYLKRELLVLMDQDNDLFKQLLMLNDAIEEIKSESSGCGPSRTRAAIATYLLEEEEEEEDDDDGDAQQPLSFDPSDLTCSSPLKKSNRIFTSPTKVKEESTPHRSPPTFNLSLPISHFHQSQQPPQFPQPAAAEAPPPLAERPTTPPLPPPPDSISVDEDNDSDEEELINELLDEALNLSSSSSETSSTKSTISSNWSSACGNAATAAEDPILPVVNGARCNNHSIDLRGPDTAGGHALTNERCPVGALVSDAASSPPPPVIVLRTQSVLLRSGFRRPRVSFPATGRNRRKNSPPVKRELLPPPPPPPQPQASHARTLPSNMRKKPQETTLTLDRRFLPVPPPQPPPMTRTPEATKEWRHVKQSSIDSGIVHSSSSSSSSTPSQSGSDTASEANSDMAM